MNIEMVLGALEQAIHARQPTEPISHYSDRGGQYLSFCYTDKLAEQNILGSVRSTGGTYDNALAETINGLYKTEFIHRQSSWKS